MSRLPPLDLAALSAAQRAVVAEVRTGRRGQLPANVLAWLPSPELARRAAALGEFVRYDTSLGARRSELAILVVARHWSCAYEWAVHAPEAERAGVPALVVAAIRTRQVPVLSDEIERALYAFAQELVSTGRVSEARHATALARLGETGVADLVGVIGYYTFVAFTLNAAAVPAPDGAPTLD